MLSLPFALCKGCMCMPDIIIGRQLGKYKVYIKYIKLSLKKLTFDWWWGSYVRKVIWERETWLTSEEEKNKRKTD